jgi:hypothetical protein
LSKTFTKSGKIMQNEAAILSSFKIKQDDRAMG